MNRQSDVSRDDVRKVAELANLELTLEEEPRMQRDLNAILGYIDQLNELNTEGIAPMTQVNEMTGSLSNAHGETLRADAIQPSIDRAAVMGSAPETDGRFFKVPKVIER